MEQSYKYEKKKKSENIHPKCALKIIKSREFISSEALEIEVVQ